MLDLRKIAITASFPAFILVARFVPFDRLPSVCGFLRLTGYPCPSCGMTRSMMALAHIDFARAMYFNPLAPVLLGLFALWWVNALYEIHTGRRTRLMAWAGINLFPLAMTGLAILMVFGAVRVWFLAHH